MKIKGVGEGLGDLSVSLLNQYGVQERGLTSGERENLDSDENVRSDLAQKGCFEVVEV